MTEPDLVKRWYGPRGYSLSVCEIDLRVGGKWRYMLRGPGGPPDMGMSGTYRELSPPDRLVSTAAFNLVDTHHGACWRVAHARQLAAPVGTSARRLAGHDELPRTPFVPTRLPDGKPMY